LRDFIKNKKKDVMDDVIGDMYSLSVPLRLAATTTLTR